MRSLIVGATIAIAAIGSPAMATTVLSDNFDTELAGTGPGGSLNYTGFANFNVLPNYVGPTAGATVDVVRNDYGISCAGGATSACVDLDGSSNVGARIVTKQGYAFNAGDVITLTFDISGNQRNGSSDDFYAGFVFASATDMLNYSQFGALNVGGPSIGNLTGIGDSAVYSTIAGNTAFTTSGLTFTAGNAGTVYAFVGALSYDNIGPLVDNFRLDITAVPEPATWALMIGGFGLMGGAVRRKQARAALA